MHENRSHKFLPHSQIKEQKGTIHSETIGFPNSKIQLQIYPKHEHKGSIAFELKHL